MSESFQNAYTVVLILLIGYFFKRIKVVDLKVAKCMSYVVMYMTLPCAIISGSSGGVDFDFSMFIIVPIAFLICFVFPMVGHLRYRDPDRNVFAMLNLGGFNIGNFVLPFMQSIMSPQGFIALCLFDVMNAFFCFGGVYCMALWFNRKTFKGGETISFKKIVKELSKSITSYCCIIAIFFAIFSIELPPEILRPLKTIGSANTFLCMFVIGVALKFDITFAQVKKILEVAVMRYGTAIAIDILIWFLLPFSAEIRLVLMAIVLAPITSMAPIMAIRSLPQFAEESADLNMISLLTSVVFITLLNTGFAVLS